MSHLVPALIMLLLGADPASVQLHPFSYPPLTPDGPFPRCTPTELRESGFPDHMHAWWWPTWRAPVDTAGQPYGPRAYCRGRTLLNRGDFPGLVLEPSRKILNGIILEHNPGYKPCDMLHFLSLVDLARRHVTELLALDTPDTLVLFNPDHIGPYREMTGQGIWRLYQWQEDRVVLQSIGVLQARSLEGHAAYKIMTEWVLIHTVGGDLPLWMTDGLAEYLAENGLHLANYMREFRPRGPVLLTPAQVEEFLAAGIDPDPERDREVFRRARYSAFLMVWELVENRGGLEPVRAFLHAVRDGTDPDRAAMDAWGMDLAGLAQALDPVQLGEPIDTAVMSMRPEVAP